MKPLVTVIITAFNMEAYIARAIENLRQQTLKELEIVVVDDGSTDNTLRICEECAKSDSRVRIVHKQNEGLAAARKTGVLHASGAYVGFVDADDTVENNMFETLLRNALKQDADISHCGYDMVFPDGSRKPYYGTGEFLIQDHEQGLVDLLSGERIEPSTCNKLYRRELFDRIEFVTDVTICEDLMLNSLLFGVAGKAVYEDQCLYHYYKHDGAMSRNLTRRQFIDPIVVRRRICENTRDESPKIRQTAKRILVSQYIRNCFMIKENRYREYRDIYLDNKKHIKELHKSCDLSKNDKVRARIVLYAPWLCGLSHKMYNMLRR